MEAINNGDLGKLCRLCMKKEGFKQPIFGIEGVHRGLSHKISVCFPFQVYETDPLPKLICHKCIYKLEQWYQFRTDVLNAFESAKKALLQRTEPEIHRYFSQAEVEPGSDNNTKTKHNGILQRTDQESHNRFSHTTEERNQNSNSKVLQNSNNQSSQSKVDKKGLDSKCTTNAEERAATHSKNLNSPNYLPCGGNTNKDLHNDETVTKSREMCVQNNKVNLNAITDTPFVKTLSTNEDVSSLVSQEQNVADVSDEVDITKHNIFDEMYSQDENYDEYSQASQEGNSESDYEQIDFKDKVLDIDYTHNHQTNIPKNVNQFASPGHERLDDEEKFAEEKRSHRHERKKGTISGTNHQRINISSSSASAFRKEENFFWCKFCLKYLKTHKQFISHNIRMHRTMKTALYGCICKRRFYTLLDMLTHRKSHLRVLVSVTDDELLTCGICQKRYYDTSMFSTHLALHYEKSHEKIKKSRLKSNSPKKR